MVVSALAWSAPAMVDITFARGVIQFVDGRILPNGVQQTFDCSERIHGVFKLSGLAPGSHLLQTRWRDPDDKVVRINTRRINVRDMAQPVYLSSSIEFRVNADVFSLLDPSAGYEAYIGNWTVEAVDQGDVIGKGRFQVIC